MLARIGSSISTVARSRTRGRLLSTKTRSCPKCDRTLPTALPACLACRHIAPVPQDMSWHDLLDQGQESNPFKIDKKVLRDAYLRAQQVCHPDGWAGQPAAAQELASAHSALVNTAYKTLSNPRERAEYILAQHGRSIQEHENLDDPELVMNIMELHERLAESEDDAERAEIATDNRAKMNEVELRLEELLGRDDWDEAKAEVIKLKYLEVIDATARGIEHH